MSGLVDLNNRHRWAYYGLTLAGPKWLLMRIRKSSACLVSIRSQGYTGISPWVSPDERSESWVAAEVVVDESVELQVGSVFVLGRSRVLPGGNVRRSFVIRAGDASHAFEVSHGSGPALVQVFGAGRQSNGSYVPGWVRTTGDCEVVGGELEPGSKGTWLIPRVCA